MPVFIVAPPRSGSTLLYEAMQRIDGLQATGREGPSILEHPEATVRWMTQPCARVLEKVPRNALRVAEIAVRFPDAVFVRLHRERQAIVASMVSAWDHPTFSVDVEGRWALLKVQGWEGQMQHPVQRRAEFLVDVVEGALDKSLAALPSSRHISAQYADLVSNPDATLSRLAVWLGLAWEPLGRCLPPSRSTLYSPVMA